MKAKIQCQFCGEEIDGECYQRNSEYSTVTSCTKPECKLAADERVEEIIEAEESGEDY